MFWVLMVCSTEDCSECLEEPAASISRVEVVRVVRHLSIADLTASTLKTEMTGSSKTLVTISSTT